MKKKSDPKAKKPVMYVGKTPMPGAMKQSASMAKNLGDGTGEMDLVRGHRKLSGPLTDELCAPDKLPGVADPDGEDETDREYTSGLSAGMRSPRKAKY